MGHAYLSSAEWRNLRSSLGFVYHPIPLSPPPPRENFFPGFLGLCLGGLRDKKKEGKKSPLVSAPQNHHPEPSCHPTWIKVPSAVAAGMLTSPSALMWAGVVGGAEARGIRSPGLNKT